MNLAHRHHRIFIGPLPEQFIISTEAHQEGDDISELVPPKPASRTGGFFARVKPTKLVNAQRQKERVSAFISSHAKQFFILNGGREDDWGEVQANGVRQEMTNRFRETEWGQYLLLRSEAGSKNTSTDKWIGQTFQVGTFLDVPVSVRTVDRPDATSYLPSQRPKLSHLSTSYKTAAASLQPAEETPDLTRAQSEFIPVAGPSSIAASETRPLTLPVKPKTKRMISFAAIDDDRITRHEQEEPVANPPGEVLARTGSAIEDTSAGAAIVEQPVVVSAQGDVVLRDRMLVRIYETAEELPFILTEERHRVLRNLRYQDWGEYMAVWRRDRLEFYNEHQIPGQERVLGRLNLNWVINLKSNKTRFGVYSFNNLTFSITCRPTSFNLLRKRRSLEEKDGTRVFIFNLKTRDRSLLWAWNIWRHLKTHTLPHHIDVYCPALDTTVKIDIPYGASTSERFFSRRNILELCTTPLKKHADWKLVMDKQYNVGNTLELAWRMNTNLQWVRGQDEEEDLLSHEETVFFGLALHTPETQCHLELRLSHHVSAGLILPDGSHLEQPPGLEGYLKRIKPRSQTAVKLYLATHKGYIFSLHPSDAHPPPPPGMHAKPGETESWRGSQQIINAYGVVDARSIIAVRRAFHLAPEHKHEEPVGNSEPTTLNIPQEHLSEDDSSDQGGVIGLNASDDRATFVMHRCFELLLKNGDVVRFEAYSRRNAVEWINYLRQLAAFYKVKHQHDATEEMEVTLEGRLKPPLTPKLHRERAPTPPPPFAEVSPTTLSTVYDWCIVDACNAMLKSGQIYIRHGTKRGPYHLVQAFLVSGFLEQYRVPPNEVLYKRRKKRINLSDAYVVSGFYSSTLLPKGEHKPDAPGIPRRYQDGLEVDDDEEDKLFTICYNNNAPIFDDTANDPQERALPKLNFNRQMAVFRARSKLERDVWCWAIKCEISRTLSTHKAREWEERLRQAGGLMDLH